MKTITDFGLPQGNGVGEGLARTVLSLRRVARQGPPKRFL